MKLLKTITTSVVFFTIMFYIFCTLTLADQQKQKYICHAQGNGEVTTISLQVNNTWQSYEFYCGFNETKIMIVETDQMITENNYKDIQLTTLYYPTSEEKRHQGFIEFEELFSQFE